MKKRFAIKVFGTNVNGIADGSFIVETRIGSSKEEVLNEFISAGKKVSILKEEEFNDPVNSLINDSNINSTPSPQTKSQSTPASPATLSNEVVEFENGGIKFKIANGIVTKFDWAEETEYKLEFNPSSDYPLSTQFVNRIKELIVEHPELFILKIKKWTQV